MSNPNQWAMMQEFFTGLERKIHENRDVIETRLKKFAEMMENAALAFNEAAKVQAELYPKLRDSTGPLAKRGWFVSGNFGMSEIMELARQCGSVSDAELDSIVAEMYRNSVDELGASLLQDYPERAFAIKPALDAHNRGEHALSVPIFFSQAEGICFTALKKYIFTNGKSSGGIDENIKFTAKERLEGMKKPDDDSNPYAALSMFMEIMWLPFAEPLPIGYGQKDRRIHTTRDSTATHLCTGLIWNMPRKRTA